MRAAQVSAGAVAKVVLVAALVVGRPLPRLPDPRRHRPDRDRRSSSRSPSPRRSTGSTASASRGGSAILLVYLGIGAAIFGIGLLLVPPLVDGVEGLSEDIPGYIDDLRENESFRDYDDRYNITESSRSRRRAAQPARRCGGDASRRHRGRLLELRAAVPDPRDQLLPADRGQAILDFFYRADAAASRAAGCAASPTTSPSGLRLRLRRVHAWPCSPASSPTSRSTLLDVPVRAAAGDQFAFFDLIPLVGATIGGVLVAIVVAFTGFPVELIVWVVVLLDLPADREQPACAVRLRAGRRGPPAGHPDRDPDRRLAARDPRRPVAIPASAAIQAVIRDYWAHSDRNLAPRRPAGRRRGRPRRGTADAPGAEG